MRPTIRPPIIGTKTSRYPKELAVGDTKLVSQRWKKKRFVNNPMSFKSANATTAPSKPMAIATKEIGTTLQVVVKSPSSAAASRSRGRSAVASLPRSGCPFNIVSIP